MAEGAGEENAGNGMAERDPDSADGAAAGSAMPEGEAERAGPGAGDSGAAEPRPSDAALSIGSATDGLPSASPVDSGVAERLSRALSAAALPAWRKAYLANLIASGRRFAEAGNARGAGYCFGKIEEALRDALSSPAAAPVPEAAPVVPPRPAERVRSRWRQDRIGHAEKVLDAYGARLSPLEKQTYRDRLERLRREAEQPSQARKADAGLLDLRRRLYQRVLKAQKVSLLRKRAPAAARAVPPARVSATPSAWRPVTGPYNDRSNLEELLAVIGSADPAWVEEFLELYSGLIGLDAFLAAAVPKK